MQRYAITQGLLPASDGDRLIARAGSLAVEGVEFLLVREKALGAGDLVELTRRVTGVAGKMRVLVSERADVALAAGAAGVHLSGRIGELRASQVRKVFPAAYVSVACHSVEDVKEAREEGADAVLFAPVFGKTVGGVKVRPGTGLESLRAGCEAAGTMAVFAMGGVTPANAERCREAGATGIAGIRMFGW